ncbi:MAG: RloB family protein [Desulfococcaceae bacterium]|nr:RloB family protein [Desulfococcaceae bacterium]
MHKKRNISSFRRKKDFRQIRIKFLIVCEGECTEPFYFQSFRVPKDVFDVRGFGMNTVSLVKKAISLKEEGDYGEIWCVFDRDDFPPQNFNNALALAKNNHINVAYSNQAFEIWS